MQDESNFGVADVDILTGRGYRDGFIEALHAQKNAGAARSEADKAVDGLGEACASGAFPSPTARGFFDGEHEFIRVWVDADLLSTQDARDVGVPVEIGLGEISHDEIFVFREIVLHESEFYGRNRLSEGGRVGGEQIRDGLTDTGNGKHTSRTFQMTPH